MARIQEPSRQVRIEGEFDLIVLGGSCTGVFAAVRAARMGLSVALVEKLNCFGGTATAGQVCALHSLMDVRYENQVVGGLTDALMKRMIARGTAEAVEKSASFGFRFNAEELKIELDALLLEQKNIAFYLHTAFCAPYVEDGVLRGVFVGNKDGRSVILGRYFVDATGDGDLCARLGAPAYELAPLQPPTACGKVQGFEALKSVDWHVLVDRHGAEFGLPADWGWNCAVPGLSDISMLAETHVFDVNVCRVADLTRAEMEGRRALRALLDLLAKYGPEGCRPQIVALCSSIGTRDTRHFESAHKVTEKELLGGVRYEDAIANGSYRVDVHHGDGAGITFRYLTGEEEVFRGRSVSEKGRWLPEGAPISPYYQVPFRALLPRLPFGNIAMAGRMIDADQGAFGALRVMVNLNQCGEAAGVAAAIAAKTDSPLNAVLPRALRGALADGGSIML